MFLRVRIVWIHAGSIICFQSNWSVYVHMSSAVIYFANRWQWQIIIIHATTSKLLIIIRSCKTAVICYRNIKNENNSIWTVKEPL